MYRFHNILRLSKNVRITKKRTNYKKIMISYNGTLKFKKFRVSKNVLVENNVRVKNVIRFSHREHFEKRVSLY